MKIAMSELKAAAERQKAATASRELHWERKFTDRDIQKMGGIEAIILKIVKNVGNIRTLIADEQLDQIVAGRDADEQIEII